MDTLPDLTNTASDLLAVIEEQARLGLRALTNEAYAATVNSSVSRIKVAALELRRAGLIDVQTNGQNQRRFFARRVSSWTMISERLNRGQARPEKRKRPCLCCREPFLSEGIGNRICHPCIARDGPPWERFGTPLHTSGPRL